LRSGPRPQNEGRPAVEDDAAFEHDAEAAMRCQHDRLLTAQQSRQHRPPAGHQGSREIGGEQRQRARQDI
jgi:hypothetical protein